jgi:hypothetical protein
MITAKNVINNLLADLARARAFQAAAARAYEREIEEVRKRYEAELTGRAATVSELEENIRAELKKHHAEIFECGGANPEDVRADLAAGSVFYRVSWPVRRARDLLERIDILGRGDLVKIARSVDWDRVEKLSDVELIELGTERKRRESYEWELVESKKEKV